MSYATLTDLLAHMAESDLIDLTDDDQVSAINETVVDHALADAAAVVETAANFEAALQAMGAFTKDGGEPLGVRPTVLMVGASNLAAAKKIIEAQLINGGDSNTNYKAVDLLQSNWLK